jgi:hypothetical protein
VASRSESSEDPALDRLIDEFTPEVARLARAALRKMRARLRGALELVYDNYNALAIGFSPTDQTSDIICSITLYPRWISLFFPNGVELPDPHRLLRGSGSKVRHVVLADAKMLDDLAIQSLIAARLERAPTTLRSGQTRRVIVKMVAKNRRPRRPS